MSSTIQERRGSTLPRFFLVRSGMRFLWRGDEWIRVRASEATRGRSNYAVNTVTGELRWFPGLEEVSFV